MNVWKRARWLLAWLAGALLCLDIFATPRTTAIHPDEVYWIGSTYYYHLAFERFDWAHPDWKLQPARENPPVAKYVLGVGLALSGQRIVDRDMLRCFHVMFKEIPLAWGEGPELAKREAVVGDMTRERCSRPMGGPGVTRPRALPYLARYVIVVCTALTSLLLFYFGSAVANRATGLLAGILYLLHPDIIYAYNRALSDPIAIMFSTAAAFAAWRFFQRFTDAAVVTRRTAAGLAIASGVLLSLACGAKMNSLVVVFVFAAAALTASGLWFHRGDRTRALQTISCAALTAVVTFVVFVAINPAILTDVPGGIAAVFTESRLNTEVQARSMPREYLATLSQRFLVTTGVTRGPLLLGVTTALAVLACLKARRPGMWFVTGWFAIAFVTVMLWIPFAWPRYVLPVMPPFILMVAHAIVTGVESARTYGTSSRA